MSDTAFQQHYFGQGSRKMAANDHDADDRKKKRPGLKAVMRGGAAARKLAMAKMAAMAQMQPQQQGPPQTPFS